MADRGPAADLAGIQPVSSRRVSEQVADQIRVLITRERLAEGDRLPPERDLAELFGVSRPMVSQALRMLSLMGLIDIRQGSAPTCCAGLDRRRHRVPCERRPGRGQRVPDRPVRGRAHGGAQPGRRALGPHGDRARVAGGFPGRPYCWKFIRRSATRSRPVTPAGRRRRYCTTTRSCSSIWATTGGRTLVVALAGALADTG